MNYKRILIEKKEDYNVEAILLKDELRNYLGIANLKEVRILNIYDIFEANEEEFKIIVDKILYEKQTDILHREIQLEDGEKAFRVKFLESQYNEREDSVNKLISLYIGNDKIYNSNTRLFTFKGIDQVELDRIKSYLINKVESKEIGFNEYLERKSRLENEEIEVIEGFRAMDKEGLADFKEEYSIGMDLEDLEFCQNYYKDKDRDPTITEIKLIDTYWSDHCRHTTFMTELTKIEFEEGKYQEIFQKTFEDYLASREYVYEDRDRPICLMDLATLNQKELKKKGLLEDKEETDEVNAASIEIKVDVDGVEEEWLLMFKNETHNHPTEIEPYGGAATCLGGAIRDPLSGRSYVYQAMRISGSADPRLSFEKTLEGKLPQRSITKIARDGYSAYGYGIGAATGFVDEIYDQGYMAKRMEVGALVAAAPKENVYRGQAEAGDLIVLVGGRTGRDGVGGAVGSSQKHTEDSMEDSGSEVQKGNPKMERKILRLFRKKKVAEMIKVCNDFGAGGASVAIGELADGVTIDLNKIPLKYEGMSGNEIALSESQERMAVLIDRENLEKFIEYSEEEDVEASLVAEVTKEKILKMVWNGQEIVNIDREFLDTNGIRKNTELVVENPDKNSSLRENPKSIGDSNEDFISNFKDLNIASKKGLSQGFDHSVGKGTVLAPFGGKNKLTPIEGMVAKLPVLEGRTTSCSLMTYGFDPKITRWSPFHGGYYAVIESIARVIALGGSYEKIRFSFQEYFRRLGEDPKLWGQPFAALLGAFKVQKALDIPAIGGKDSMSGSFEDLHVPPTFISFAVTVDKLENILSPEFKEIGSRVVLLKLDMDENYLLDLKKLKSNYSKVKELVNKGRVLGASSVKYGGYGRSIGEMAMGNSIGFKFSYEKDIYKPLYGSIVLELDKDTSEDELRGLDYIDLGETIEEEKIILRGSSHSLEDLINAYREPLEEVFPEIRTKDNRAGEVDFKKFKEVKLEGEGNSKRVKILIPIVTGSYGEYDLGKSFSDLGGEVKYFVIKTKNKETFEKSLRELADLIDQTDILALADGKIMGNEPEAGGKLYKEILNYKPVKKAVNDHVNKKAKLILGIGAGSQALIKSGLIEYGEIRQLEEDSLYITNNYREKYVGEMVDIEVRSNLSPWLSKMEVGDIYTVPLGTKEGRIIGARLKELIDRGQIATVFKDDYLGSSYSIDGLTSPKGRILATTSSIERIDRDLYKNIDKKGLHKIFEAGIEYFQGR